MLSQRIAGLQRILVAMLRPPRELLVMNISRWGLVARSGGSADKSSEGRRHVQTMAGRNRSLVAVAQVNKVSDGSGASAPAA